MIRKITMQELHLEPLGGGINIYVTKSYHFSTDTILLAHFANQRGGRRRVDLGAGCGTIGLLWLKDDRNLDVSAVQHLPGLVAKKRRAQRLGGAIPYI